jgi:AdoMet-dependent heme synthase
MKRNDIVELVGYAAQLGLRVAITPATTPLTTRAKLTELRQAGLSRLAVSLDGSSPAIHDAFRGVSGSFAHGLRILRTAQEIGLTTQVNTVIARHNLDDFEGLCALMADLGIVFWEVFFLVPMGRARPADLASAEEFEAVFHRLFDLSKVASYDVKATAAPQYTRVLLEREKARGAADGTTAAKMASAGQRDGIGRARGVNDGDGFLFISHTGEIYPSGFLPISAGNVRRDDLVEVYRHNALFRQLRDRSLLKGKCGVCEYQAVCGGSRARSYAMTGDFLASEPCCAHVPRRWQRMLETGEVGPAGDTRLVAIDPRSRSG